MEDIQWFTKTPYHLYIIYIYHHGQSIYYYHESHDSNILVREHGKLFKKTYRQVFALLRVFGIIK